MTTYRRPRANRFTTLVGSLLFIAPFGYGLPYLSNLAFGPSIGALLLLLLLGPSIIRAALLAHRLGQDTDVAASPIVGCVAPIVGFLVFILTMVVVDYSCERWSLACGGTQLWSVLGFMWASIVVACLWIASVGTFHRNS